MDAGNPYAAPRALAAGPGFARALAALHRSELGRLRWASGQMVGLQIMLLFCGGFFLIAAIIAAGHGGPPAGTLVDPQPWARWWGRPWTSSPAVMLAALAGVEAILVAAGVVIGMRPAWLRLPLAFVISTWRERELLRALFGAGRRRHADIEREFAEQVAELRSA